jgi:hypothetical protein
MNSAALQAGHGLLQRLVAMLLGIKLFSIVRGRFYIPKIYRQ